MDSDESVPEEASGESVARRQLRPAILVVDDDPYILRLLKEVLEDEGYSVLTAANGQQALAEAHKAPLALVFTDYMMPRLDGFELCRQLRSSIDTADTPVVLLSAVPPSDDAGLFVATINKPFMIETILEHVQQYGRFGATGMGTPP